MAIEVKLYSFSKKENSTKRPGGDGLVVSGNLNNNTSITAPAISFKADVTITKYNYAYIAEFSRYYKITSWEYVLGLWRASMVVDALASWKPEIGNMSAYVLRSASANNPDVIDGLFPSTAPVGVIESTANSVFTGENYIVQYTGKSGLKAVQIGKIGMEGVCQSLWNTWNTIDGMNEVYASIADPFQYVLGIQKTYAEPAFWQGASSSTIVLGNVNTGVGGLDVTDATGRASVTLSIPKHPQAANRPFVKKDPYSKYSIRIPGIGWIEVPAGALYNASSLTVQFYAEPSSGNMRADVVVGGSVIASGSGSINTNWGYGGATSSAGNPLVSAGLNMAASFLNNIGVKQGIMDYAGGLTSTVQQSGGMTGCVGMGDPLILQLKYQMLVADNNADHGRPLMQERKINTLSGYLITDDAHFSAPATTGEIDIINQALIGGMFYE